MWDLHHTIIIMVRTRGLLIAGTGTAIFGISFLIAGSIVTTDFSGPAGFDVESMFEGMFDDTTDNMLVMPGDYVHASFAVDSDDALVMWGVHMVDYRPGDSMSVSISDYTGEVYDTTVLTEMIEFGIVESMPAGTANFEIRNYGDDPVEVSVLFSEDPEDSEMFTDPNSPLNRVIMPLVVVGTLVIVGLLIVIVGIVIFLMDMRRQQHLNRFGSRGRGHNGTDSSTGGGTGTSTSGYDDPYGDGR